MERSPKARRLDRVGPALVTGSTTSFSRSGLRRPHPECRLTGRDASREPTLLNRRMVGYGRVSSTTAHVVAEFARIQPRELGRCSEFLRIQLPTNRNVRCSARRVRITATSRRAAGREGPGSRRISLRRAGGTHESATREKTRRRLQRLSDASVSSLAELFGQPPWLAIRTHQSSPTAPLRPNPQEMFGASHRLSPGESTPFVAAPP